MAIGATTNIRKGRWWLQHRKNSTVSLRFSGITGNQEFWRETRRFALRSMRDFGLGKQSLDQRIKNEGLTLAEQFRGRNGQGFDPQDDLTKAVSNIICSIAFGKRYYYVFTNPGPPKISVKDPGFPKRWCANHTGVCTNQLLPSATKVMFLQVCVCPRGVGVVSQHVDPVHLFLSLSSETEFRQKPQPIAVSAVACININL